MLAHPERLEAPRLDGRAASVTVIVWSLSMKRDPDSSPSPSTGPRYLVILYHFTSDPSCQGTRSVLLEGGRPPPTRSIRCGVGMPTDIGVFDTLIGLPSLGRVSASEHPAGYLFPSPYVRRDDDSVAALLYEMDRYGIEHGLVPSPSTTSSRSPPSETTRTGCTAAWWSTRTSGWPRARYGGP